MKSENIGHTLNKVSSKGGIDCVHLANIRTFFRGTFVLTSVNSALRVNSAFKLPLTRY